MKKKKENKKKENKKKQREAKRKEKGFRSLPMQAHSVKCMFIFWPPFPPPPKHPP